MERSNMMSAWSTGECPYGFTCDNTDECPGVSIPVSLEDGHAAEAIGLNVSYGMSSRTGSFQTVHICDRALEDKTYLDLATELDASATVSRSEERRVGNEC